MANVDKLVALMLVIALGIGAYNSFQISKIGSGAAVTGAAVADSTDVIPTGVPKIYGSELGVSFDDVTPYDRAKADATIGVLANLDRTIELDGDNLERYISIGTQISCEYCCGAKAIIFDNGKAACGCAHSYAMRGLAKYLILNHGSEYSNDEILEEMGKWKTLFFPSQITSKAQVLSERGIELSYVNLASNKYRGIEKGTGGGMVGGC
jgi:hypothetical protein